MTAAGEAVQVGHRAHRREDAPPTHAHHLAGATELGASNRVAAVTPGGGFCSVLPSWESPNCADAAGPAEVGAGLGARPWSKAALESNQGSPGYFVLTYFWLVFLRFPWGVSSPKPRAPQVPPLQG